MLKQTFSKTGTFLRRLRGDRQGNVMTLMGLSMIPLIGTVGLAVDGAQWISWRRDLRSAADTAAIAGAQAMRDGTDVTTAVNKVLGYNAQRSYTVEAIETPPTSGTYAGNANMVRVILSVQQSLPFSSLFLRTAPKIQVISVAEASTEVANCMIALDRSGTGISITGSATVNMNCGLASNSNFDATSAGSITAGALSAVGTVSEGNSISSDTAVNNGIAAAEDPYSSLDTQPNQTCNNRRTYSGAGNTATPGCYSGIQIQANATLTLAPGTYYIGERGLSVGGNATLIGNGVTLIFTNTDSPFNASRIGSFSSQGTSSVQLTSPSSGAYEGILMIQDSRITPTNANRMILTGNGSSQYDGSIYAPTNKVVFTGNSTMITDCLQIISLYIEFGGNTSVSNTCPAGRGSLSLNGDAFLRLRQ
ncbi:MAG: pilus assembly protein TadG-related protein [Erythrobacter sp.]